MENIFSNIPLSLNIPFVKIRDPLTKKVICKLFEETISIENNYIPKISKSKIINWVKNQNVQFNIDKKQFIKNNFKHLIYKIYIGDFIINESKRHGTVIKKNGETFNIRYLDGSIHTDVQYTFIYHSLSNLKTSENSITKRELNNINYGSKVAIISHEKKYATLEITNDGVLNLKLDFYVLEKKLNNITFHKIEKYMLKRINDFVKDVNNSKSDELNLQYIYPFHSKINNKYNDYNIVTKNLNYYIDVEYTEDLFSHKELLSNISKCFYPYITLVNDDILLNQEVEFEIEDGRYRGIVIEIKKNNTSIVKRDDTGEVLTLENAKIRHIKNKNMSHILHLKYKTISGYEKMSPLQSFIRKNMDMNVSNDDIVTLVSKYFFLNTSIAAEQVRKMVDSKIKNTLETSFPGYDIKINLKSKNNLYRIYFENVTDTYYIKELNNVIINLFHTLHSIINETDLRKYEINFKECSRLKDSEKDFEEQNIIEDDIDKLNKYFANDSGEEDDDIESSDDDIESLDDDNDLFIDTVVQVEKMTVKIKTIPKSNKIDKIDDNPILKRLQMLQSKLFYSDTSMRPNKMITYTGKLGNPYRYPIILSESEKTYIDENHPGSYGTNINSSARKLVDCSNLNIKELDLDNTHSCRAIKYGIPNEDKYWYICPRIYDIQENSSINLEELEYNNGRSSFEPLQPDSYEKNWRTDNKGKDILEFNPSYKGRTSSDKKKAKGSNMSLRISPSKTKNYTYYPGFLDPGSWSNNRYVPACYKNPNRNVQQAFGIKGIDKKTKSDYIQNWGKNLKKERYGLLPNELYSFFEMDKSKCVTGSVSSVSKCYLRVGVSSQPNNSFISAYAETISSKKKYTEATIIKSIIENLSYQDFKILNKGSLEILFKSNDFRIKPFQNFVEYLISDENKEYKILGDLFSKPKKWLWENTENTEFIIVIIEVFYDSNNKSSFKILCPKYQNLKIENKKMMIFLKNYNVYEPIYFYSGTFKKTLCKTCKFTKKIFKKIVGILKNTKNCYLNSDDIIKKRIESYGYYTPLNSKELNVFLQGISQSPKNSIKLQLRDSYNKIVAVLDNNNNILPVFPSEIIDYIDVQEIYEPIPNIKEPEIIIEHLKFIADKLKNNSYLPKKIISIPNDDINIIKGIVLNSYHIIPTKETEDMDKRQFYLLDDTRYDKISLDLLDIEKNNFDISIKIPTNSLNYKKYNNIVDYLKIFNSINQHTFVDIEEIKNMNFKIKYKLCDSKKNITGLVIKPNDSTSISSKKEENPKYLVIPINNQKDILGDIPEKNSSEIEGKYLDYELTYTLLFNICTFSKGILNILPIRFLMNNDKKLKGYILENGLIINFETCDFPSSHEEFFRNLNNRKISFNKKAFTNYQNTYPDKRIITVKKINHMKQLYQRYRKNISKFININSRYHKKKRAKILEIFNKKDTSNNSKRIELFSLIDEISQHIVTIQNESKINLKEQSVHTETRNCNSFSNEENCSKNNFCFWVENTKHIGSRIRKRTTPYKIFSKTLDFTDKDINELIEDYETSLEEKSYHTGYLQKKKKLEEETITKINKSKFKNNLIKNLINIYWRKLSKNEKKNFEIEALRINTDKREHAETKKGAKCMLMIYNNDYRKYVNKIVEELIRNNIKRREIIEGAFKIETDERFKFIENTEVMFTEMEFSKQFINELFQTYTKSLLQRFNVFLIDSPEEDYDIIGKENEKYFVNSSQIFKTGSYTYTLQKSIPKTFNEFEPIILTQSKYYKLEDMILKLNSIQHSKINKLTHSKYSNTSKYTIFNIE